jgi:hypothetical protein
MRLTHFPRSSKTAALIQALSTAVFVSPFESNFHLELLRPKFLANLSLYEWTINQVGTTRPCRNYTIASPVRTGAQHIQDFFFH